MKVSNSENGLTRKIVVEDLAEGMAETWGNFLRRTILLGDEGWSVIGARLNGGAVTTKFDVIEGVLEECIEVCHRLASMDIVEAPGEIGECRVLNVTSKGGAKDLAYGDFGINVLGREEKLCTLIDGKSVNMEVVMRYGKGYVDEQSNKFHIRGAVDESVAGDYISFASTHRRAVEKCYYKAEGGRLELTIEMKSEQASQVLASVFSKTLGDMEEIFGEKQI